jgi:cytidine deaminase
MKERVLSAQGLNSEIQHGLTPEQNFNFSILVHLAGEANAYPDQSGFFVRTAGVTKNGIYYRGGNKEYGHSDAFIHGETAVASGLRDLTDQPIEAIAWYRKGEIKPTDFGRPCGNCRDILRKYCTPELFLLNGNEKAFVVAQLKDYLFENFRKIEFSKIDTSATRSALNAARGGNDVYLPEKMKPEIYGAALVAEDGSVWTGDHYSNVGYDSVTPVLSAVIGWHNDYPKGAVDKNRLRLSKLVIVGEHTTPDVFYRDRQAILELDEILRKFTKVGPLKVQIINFDGLAYETNVEEWLPGPFSPGAFRMDDVMLGQLGKLVGEKNLNSLN